MAETPTRKLAAILAADVVGYSRLMGTDEAGTHAALKGHLTETVGPLVAAHSGRIFKTTGDGFLAEYASAVQAVECAVAIQRACMERNRDFPAEKQLHFRIGINLGDVIADGDDVFGDGVNVAARLQAIAEPGGICASQAVYQQVVGKVGVSFANIGARTLKNIAGPVQAFSVKLGFTVEPGADATPPPIEDRPSIAVLPFEDLSGDRNLDLLADGLAEDIITLLARVAGFFVIARSSSSAYKHQTPDVRQAGRELGVGYVVTGSLRSSESRVRVGVQLVDAATGRELWSQRYDVERSATLDLQDQIARAIIVELEPQLTRAELSIIQRQRPENLDAWSRYRKAVGALALKGWNEESVPGAIRELEETVRLYPDFALAHGILSLLNSFGANLALVKDIPAARHKAFKSAERAIAIDSEGSEVLGYAGCAVADLGENARGCELLERAVENDPSNAQARVALGAAQARLRKFDPGIENMRLGMRTSPRDVRLGLWGTVLAQSLLAAGRVEEALEEAKTASRRDGRLYGARIAAALALLQLARHDEATSALIEARRIRPPLGLGELEGFFGKKAVKALRTIWIGSEAKAAD